MKLLKNTRKKVVTLAVASALGGVAMMSAPAHAMNVAQDGKGEVLLFPYYTVLNGFDTLLSVTNTSNRTVVFKVRFREAKNSREVRDFNVALSPHDIWTAGVTIDGSGTGALVRTFDKSCTSPQLPGGPNGSTQVDFTSVGYDGTDPKYAYDNGGKSLTRVQEGYIEIIEMAISTIPESSIASAALIEYNTQHVSGVPRNCAVFDAAFLDSANLDNVTNAPSGSGVFSTFTAPANVLTASATLINVAKGTAFDATPTAIQAFQDSNTIIFPPGDLFPNLTNGELLPTANMLVDGLPVAAAIAPHVTTINYTPVDAVSALLAADNLINEYAAGGSATSGARTDWVVTFPTKHFYTDLNSTLALAVPPFHNAFAPTGRACDPIALSLYDREEKTQISVGQNQFSPAPSGPAGASLCNEVNVLNLTAGATPLPVLGSSVQLAVDTSTVGSSGWANLATPAVSAVNGFTGLPAIGFNVVSRDNTAEAGNNRNYGTGNDHARTVVFAAP